MKILIGFGGSANRAFAFLFCLTALVARSVGQPAAPPAPADPAGNAPAGSPRIQFATPVFDFGKLGGGQSVKHEFVFTNTGNAVLEILSVTPSCGCTTAGEWTKKVEPGKTGTIPLQFNSGTFSGVITKTVTVASNDKQQPSVVLQLRGNVWKAVDTNPQYALLSGNVETIGQVESKLRVINNEETPLVLSPPEVSNPAFIVTLKTNQPGKEFELSVKTVSTESANSQGQITMKTSSTNAPTLTITAMTLMQPVVITSPAQVVLPASPMAEKVTHTITIRNNGTNVMTLSEPKVNVPGVEVAMQEPEAGRAFTISVTFPAKFEVPAGTSAELNVKSSHPQFALIKVPIVQLPRPVAAVPPAPAQVPASQAQAK